MGTPQADFRGGGKGGSIGECHPLCVCVCVGWGGDGGKRGRRRGAAKKPSSFAGQEPCRRGRGFLAAKELLPPEPLLGCASACFLSGLCHLLACFFLTPPPNGLRTDRGGASSQLPLHLFQMLLRAWAEISRERLDPPS